MYFRRHRLPFCASFSFVGHSQSLCGLPPNSDAVFRGRKHSHSCHRLFNVPIVIVGSPKVNAFYYIDSRLSFS